MSFGSIFCQQCKEPLSLDASLIDLAPSTYDMIAATLPASQSYLQRQTVGPTTTISSSSTAKDVWHRAHISASSKTLSSRGQGKQPERSGVLSNSPTPNESFVFLKESAIRDIPLSVPSPNRSKKGKTHRTPVKSADVQVATQFEPDHDPSPLSHHLRSTVRLLNLLSSRTDIDHPLCAECTQILLHNLQRQLDETKRERDGYIAYEKEARKEREKEEQGPSKEEIEKRIEKLKREEHMAIEQLKEAERERQQLDEELRQLHLDQMALEIEEAEFWRAHNDHMLTVEQQAAQSASLRAAYAADMNTLEKLERTNVYNDAFCIGHDGVFGTINGLRLGRVPGVPVEWTEINAAWGQTLLLLYTIARKLDYTFEHYRLVPMGSFSRIEKTTGDKATYELYGSGDLHFGRLLHNRRFDIAMVAFLDCLKHLIDHVKSQDPSVEFPHQVSKDKIGDVSVKLQFNQEDAWTRSLRHVLLALKICLKWTTNGANS
ncbi:hypothetical protein C0993_007932 [Termitomyces sp. T159_Od127]|nr:hypothetical protein C0993_007932 [Termitomyces sp. T159_Od127]